MTDRCPKCGGTTGYLVRVRLMGEVTHIGHWGGDETPADTSELRSVAAKTVVCRDCGRRTITKNLKDN